MFDQDMIDQAGDIVEMLELPLHQQKRVGPFMGVSLDKMRTFENNRTFRLIRYSAKNALGAISYERGLAILDEDNKQVLTDRINVSEWGKLREIPWQEFKEYVNKNNRTRMVI